MANLDTLTDIALRSHTSFTPQGTTISREKGEEKERESTTRPGRNCLNMMRDRSEHS